MTKTSHIIILTLALVVAFSACAHDQEKRNQAKFYTQMGISNLVEQNCTEALRFLLEAEKRDAESAELQNALGLSYFCKNEYELAVGAYSHAVRLRPNFSEAWNNLGAAHAALGQYDKAIEAFDKALEDLVYQTPEQAWLNKGLAYAARHDYGNAEKSFKKAVSVALPKAGGRDVVCRARNDLGKVQLQQKRYVDSLHSLRASTKLCPKYAQPYYLMSMVYVRLDKKEEAIAACKRVIALSPDSMEGEACKQWNHVIQGGR